MSLFFYLCRGWQVFTPVYFSGGVFVSRIMQKQLDEFKKKKKKELDGERARNEPITKRRIQDFHFKGSWRRYERLDCVQKCSPLEHFPQLKINCKGVILVMPRYLPNELFFSQASNVQDTSNIMTNNIQYPLVNVKYLTMFVVFVSPWRVVGL